MVIDRVPKCERGRHDTVKESNPPIENIPEEYTLIVWVTVKALMRVALLVTSTKYTEFNRTKISIEACPRNETGMRLTKCKRKRNS